jgi:hypothetical protein
VANFCEFGNHDAPLEIEIKTRKVCERCKFWLGKSIVMQKGVRNAVVDIKTQTIMIIYNAKKTSPDILRKYIVSIGYDADILKANIQKREILRDCCLMNITICK